MPGKMGIIAIRPLKTSNPFVNWVATKKLWKEHPELHGKQLVKFLNLHTDGFYFKVAWKQRGFNMRYKELYSFTPVRSLKLKLFKSIMNGKEYVTQ